MKIIIISILTFIIGWFLTDIINFIKKLIDRILSKCISVDEKIKNALMVANSYGGVDGSHHKMWTIDQMIRCLHGCKQDKYEEYIENEEYKLFIKEHCKGEDGPNTYDWDIGIAP